MRISDWSSDVCSSDLIGFAEALGKPVFLWSEATATLAERTPAASTGRDAEGWMIENFGLAENLMIGINDFGPVASSFAAALAGAKRRFALPAALHRVGRQKCARPVNTGSVSDQGGTLNTIGDLPY